MTARIAPREVGIPLPGPMLFQRQPKGRAVPFAQLRARVLSETEPDLLIDAGASRGGYARRVRAGGYEGRILSLEPLPDSFAKLSKRAERDPLWECRQVAVGSRPGAAEMSVAANAVSSSLLEMTETHTAWAPKSKVVGTETVEVTTLDDLGVDPEGEVFLKCDLQGYELEALRGGPRILEQATGLELELSFRELYAGQSLLDEVMAHVFERGFRCVALERGFTQKGGYWLQADGLFVRV